MGIVADSITWIAAGAAVLGLALLVPLRLFRARASGGGARRGRRGADEVAELRAALARAVAASRRAEQESERLRHFAALHRVVDLETLLDRALESAVRLSGAAGATLILADEEGGEPLVATFGLSADEASRRPLGLPPRGTDARAVTVQYRYTENEIAHDEFRLRGGVAVPLRSERGEPVGTLALFWRKPWDAGDHEVSLLEDLAAVLLPALATVRRFEELRGPAEAGGAVAGGRRFEERLRREYARARRYERRLALLLLDLGAVPEPTLAAAGDRISATVRATDAAFHLGDGRFALLLPEAGARDAESLRRRLSFALAGGGPQAGSRPRPAAAVAELHPDDDAVSLLRRAEGGLHRAGTPERVESGGTDV